MNFLIKKVLIHSCYLTILDSPEIRLSIFEAWIKIKIALMPVSQIHTMFLLPNYIQEVINQRLTYLIWCLCRNWHWSVGGGSKWELWGRGDWILGQGWRNCPGVSACRLTCVSPREERRLSPCLAGGHLGNWSYSTTVKTLLCCGAVSGTT